MITLHKVLPLFFLPIAITLLLVAVSLLFRRPRLCWAAIAVLWTASAPVVSDRLMRAAEGWQERRPVAALPTAHAIVVLSYGRIEPPGDVAVSEWQDPDRFFGGVELFKAKKAPLLVFTGGRIPGLADPKSEGEVLRDYAIEIGISRDRVLTTRNVVNTEEESHAVAELLAKQVGASVKPTVLLVTSAFHMRRAQLLFARAGLETAPFPVDFKVSGGKRFSLMDLLPDADALGKSETALRELYGLAYYRFLRG